MVATRSRRPVKASPEEKDEDRVSHAPAAGRRLRQRQVVVHCGDSRNKLASKRRGRRASSHTSTSSAENQCPSPVKRSARQRVPQRGAASLEDALRRLHASSAPQRLPCRAAEFDAVCHFVRSNVVAGTSRSLFISGVPGTGKTATTLQAVERLQLDRKLPSFTFVHVNGMRLADSGQVYVEILAQLNDVKRRSAASAQKRLNAVFESASNERDPIVLLVDEMDLLCTRRQQILYQLFEWATLDTARLTVVAIANTLDLPERLLTQRVSSRLGMSRLCFQSYDFKQIGEIVRARLESVAVVDADAVEFVSRKVAAVSGDLRKALDVCRAAVALALQRRDTRLTLAHVHAALQQCGDALKTRAVRACSAHEQLVLRAAVAETRRTGREEWDAAELRRQYALICAIESVAPLDTDQLARLFARLSASRLLVFGSGVGERTRKCRLALSVEDVNMALRFDSLVS